MGKACVRKLLTEYLQITEYVSFARRGLLVVRRDLLIVVCLLNFWILLHTSSVQKLSFITNLGM